MNEINIQLENISSNGFGFKVNKSDSHKGGLIIKEIFDDTPASVANLKIGDYIVKVNNKNTKRGRNKMITEINESRCDKLTMVIKREIKESRHQSFMNLSSLSSLTNSSGQAFRNSKSSVDLNYNFPATKQILDSNFVTEDSIDNFIQKSSFDSPTGFAQNCRTRVLSLFTLETSLDDDRADSDSPKNSQKHFVDAPPSPITNVQFTRKQAYRKVPDESESIVQSQKPRFNLKKATRTGTVLQKDPNYVVKKKTNSLTADGQLHNCKNVVLNSNAKSRFPTAPIARNTMLNVGSISNTSINKSQTPSPICFQSTSMGSDFEDGNFMSSSKNVIQPTSTPTQHTAVTTAVESVPLPMEIMLEMKITVFKDKISKPVLKKYLLEQEASGVIFECQDVSEMQSSLNSTALNPSIVSADLIMNVWSINNTSTRFFLPIGQIPYDSEIIRTVALDEIKIAYPRFKLEFIINLTRVPLQHHSNLFKLLQVDPPEPKLPPIKPKKSISGASEPRKTKSSKSSEILLLSVLHKTEIVKGVPLAVIVCVAVVESIGLKEEGIYRKSGNLVGKRLLEDTIYNETPDKWSSHDEWANVHITASLLKAILRRYILFDKDTAIKLSVIKLDIEEMPIGGDTDRKLQAVMDMIYHLNTHFKSHTSADENKCRIDTFKYIIKHLYRVSLCYEYNKMNADNLARCFMPTLIEDIPSDDDTEYKTSKKNVIHENLTKIVAFWITYSDTMCEFLEEEREDELNRKVINFLNENHHYMPDHASMLMNNYNDRDLDVAILVKRRIEYYTESAIGINSNSPHISNSNNNTPESFFSRTKNSRPYQSVKQPRKLNIRRRNSSGSPIDGVKLLDVIKPIDGAYQKTNAKLSVGSPQIPRKTDIWPTRIVKKKKESSPSDIPGIELISLLISGCKKDVPLVVMACIKIIEKFGIDIDGIYRISGRSHDVTNLDLLVMSNDTSKWLSEPNIRLWSNMHNTACLLKKVLKKFCLIPKETWTHMSSQFSEKLEPEDVKNVLKAAAYYLRVEQSKSTVSVISGRFDYDDTKNDAKQCEARFRSGTLRYVLQHLKRVATHESVNRMNSNSLAICFVPVLMEEDYDRKDIVVINTKCIQIVQLLIDHCDWIFQWDGRPSEEIYGQTMTDSLDHYLRTYSMTLCRDFDQNANSLVAEHDEVHQLLNGLIESSFHFSDVAANSLRIYFDNKVLSSSILPIRSGGDS